MEFIFCSSSTASKLGFSRSPQPGLLSHLHTHLHPSSSFFSALAYHRLIFSHYLTYMLSQRNYLWGSLQDFVSFVFSVFLVFFLFDEMMLFQCLFHHKMEGRKKHFNRNRDIAVSCCHFPHSFLILKFNSFKSQYLPISQWLSLYIDTSPHVSLYILAIHPHISYGFPMSAL